MQRGFWLARALILGIPSVSAAAQAPPPAIVVLALDTSGSIAAADLSRTRVLAQGLFSSLPTGSEVALLTFDDQSRILVHRTPSAETLRAALAGVKISGRYTALHDALYESSRYLRSTPRTRKAVVLVTDGRDENSALDLDDGLGDARDSGIPIFTVGIGKVEERVLRRIAKLTSGEYAPIGLADAKQLAARVAALPAVEPTPEPVALAATRAPAPAPLAAAPVEARGQTALSLVLIGGVALAAILGLIAIVSRRPAPPVASESAGGEDFANAASDSPAPEDDGYSPTVMAKLDASDEYLEKTFTLTERPVLVFQGGPHSGQLHVLSRQTTTTLGRAHANDIVLDDVSVSSQHSRIRLEDGRFVVHDLKSTNGTFVNERKIARQALRTGDVIRLGETRLLFRLEQKKL